MNKLVNTIWLLLLSCFVLSIEPAPAARALATQDDVLLETERYQVHSAGHSDRAHSTLPNQQVRTYRFDIVDKQDGTVRQAEIGGELLDARAASGAFWTWDERMVVEIDNMLFVIELRSGATLETLQAQFPTPSPSGRWIAYREVQSRGLPVEMQGVVISFLDLASLDTRPLFPEESAVKPRVDPLSSALPRLVAHQRIAERCFTSELFWADDERHLAFHCVHRIRPDGRISTSPDDTEHSLVVVDLAEDGKQSTFERFPVPRSLYVREGAELPETPNLFRPRQLFWLEDGRLEILLGQPWAPEALWLNPQDGTLAARPAEAESQH